MSSLGYLLALLVSAGCMLLIDRRWRLYLFAAPGRALIVQAAGVALFLVADLVGIGSGIFQRGEGPYLSGLDLAPHLPVEEPIFLWFLCHVTMLAFTGARRLLDVAAARQGAGVEAP